MPAIRAVFSLFFVPSLYRLSFVVLHTEINARNTIAGSFNISKVPKNTQCNSAYKSIIRYYNELLKLILLTVIELD